MKLQIEVDLIDADDNWYRTDLPAKYIVCPRCEGRGTHVNPSIDDQGLSSEDLEDEDFREAYFSGAYDVRCFQCEGHRVVPDVDWNALTTEEQADLKRYEIQRERDDLIAASERKRGC